MDRQPDSRFLNRCTKLLSWFCPPQLVEGIGGDLEEQYHADSIRLGVRRARRRVLLSTLRFFHHEIILRNKFTLRLINSIMLGNYIRVAARNIQRRKLYSAINAFGLSIGIAFCMLIWLFIEDERNFDQFHENKARIFRIEESSYNAWNPALKEDERWRSSAHVQLGLLPALKEDLPEIEFGTRFTDSEAVLSVGEKVFNEDVRFVDGDFFRMFSFRLLQGSREELFSSPHEVVLTPDIARKYFADIDPMGKVMIIDEKSFTVTGIIEPPPPNSSIGYSVLLPQESQRDYDRAITWWGNFSTPAFVQLRAGTDQPAFDANMNKAMEKHTDVMLTEWRKEAGLPPDFKMVEYTSSPLVSIHMNPKINWYKVSNPQYSYILGGVALVILLIACINYISLALTTSAARRTEVGIRKVVGAQRSQLVHQFAFESIVLAVISSLAAIGFVVIFLPFFNDFTGKGIRLESFATFQLLGVSLALGFLVGLLAGSYPALFLSRFRPALVLKGRFTTKLQAGFTRPLVILQFALSAFLIISSLIMYRQMEFIASRDLGFDKEAVIVVPLQTYSGGGRQRVRLLRERLTQEPGVLSVGATNTSFNQGWSRTVFEINGEKKAAYTYSVDEHYVPTLNFELIAGRNFDENIPSDSDAVIVNEALVRDMKWENPVGEHYNWTRDSLSVGAVVIGVVKDYHYRSLEAPIEPVLLHMEWGLSMALVKLSPGGLRESIDRVGKAWKDILPDVPFSYSFLDEDLAKQYTSYKRWLNVMGFSTAFAIIISCLGLFGLAGINAVNRTKEMGIRKVMGADMSNIFVLLNRQYIVFSLIAFSVAIPLSYYAMNRWLSDFKFRIEMGWEIFGISILIGLAVALLTVSYHGLKAGLVNPAETLKYE